MAGIPFDYALNFLVSLCTSIVYLKSLGNLAAKKIKCEWDKTPFLFSLQMDVRRTCYLYLVKASSILGRDFEYSNVLCHFFSSLKSVW